VEDSLYAKRKTRLFTDRLQQICSDDWSTAIYSSDTEAKETCIRLFDVVWCDGRGQYADINKFHQFLKGLSKYCCESTAGEIS